MPRASTVINAKDLKESSKKLYLSQLSRLNDDKEPTTYKVFQDTEAIEKKLEGYSDSSKRTFYASICAYLPETNKAKKFYYKRMMDINKQKEENIGKSQKQEDNWLSQEEVKDVWASQGEYALPACEKSFSLRSRDETNLIRCFVILSLYVLQSPRRSADYTEMVIVPQYTEGMDKKYNYLSLDDQKFYFNNYKTSGTYNTQIVPVNDILFDIILCYIGNRKEGLLLVTEKGKKMTNSSMTKTLNTLFQKKISVSMLRNIYLTDKYAGGADELRKDAISMGTSTECAMNHYIKENKGK
jgi:hypothetical protein